MVIKGENIFSFLNDDVIIQSNVKMGKKLEDARLYSAGGCQEPVLDDKEFNSRAFIYISLPQLVNLFMFGDLQKLFKDKRGYSISDKKYTTFEEFYDEYIQCLSIVYQALVTRANHYEKGAAEDRILSAGPSDPAAGGRYRKRGKDHNQGDDRRRPVGQIPCL